ncbi:fibroblast growth factor receptor 2-like [Liolophura sinensis]|uniref:fibroblast growth factor receptor 2-like n=1 Tax=Liolophura sinensis TaxID=3198878 RepID=UPI00315867E2
MARSGTFLYLQALVSCVLFALAASECKLKERTLKEGEQFENCTQTCRCVYGSLNCQRKQCPSTQEFPISRCLQQNTRVPDGQCCSAPVCERCGASFFGPDCRERCGACASGRCHPKTGVCKRGTPLCKSGYIGNQCKEACGAGTWGHECQQNCSNNCVRGNQECDKRDGTCIGGCLPGFYGSLCEPAQSTIQLSTVVGIGVGIGLFILVIIVICTVICLYRRRARQDALSKRDSYLSPVALNNTSVPSRNFLGQTDDYEMPINVRNESIPVYSSPYPPVYCSMDIQDTEDELIYEMMLPRTNWNVSLADMEVSNTLMTQGNFGETRLALWNHNVDKSLCTHVGLKRFPGNGSDERKNLINGQLEKLRSLDRCINVLAVLGVSTDPNTGDSLLILECSERGSLLTYLKQNRFESSKKEELTEKRLTKLCQDVAYGMKYISSYSITNVDLAADTVLMDKFLNAKITGMVHFQEKDQTQDQVVVQASYSLTLYPPIQLFSVIGGGTVFLSSPGILTIPCYSWRWRYGVLMWEVFSLGETPYSDISVKDLLQKLESGCRLGHPADTRTMT